MSDTHYNDFIEIFYESLKQTNATGNFDSENFLAKMEEKFTELGFRDEVHNKGTVENILILRCDAIGDFILNSAAIRELRKNYPRAHITLVVRERVYPLAEFCPYVNEILTFDISDNEIETMARSVEFAEKYLWDKHFDLGISFRYWTNFSESLLLYLSGARIRLGYFMLANGIYLNKDFPLEKDWRLTHPVQQPKEVVHDVARDLYLLKDFGLKIENTELELWYTRQDYYQAKNLLQEFSDDTLKISVGIGAGHPARRYPVEKYLEAFKKIAQKDVAFFIFGGDTEAEDAKFLQDNLPKDQVKNLVELKLSWRVTAALVAQTDLYLGNDTGVAHCAAISHIPTIKLMPEAKDREFVCDRGLSQVAQYYPWQTAAIVLRPEHPLEGCKDTLCYSGCAEKKPHCITQIEPDEIITAFNEMTYFMYNSQIKRIGVSKENPLAYKYEFDY